MIKFLDDGNVDLKLLEMSDIIDVQMFQQFLDNFAIGMNCAAVSVDRSGAPVTDPSYYRQFCENYIHKSKIGDDRCASCHNEMGEKAARQGKPYVGSCHAGLIDFAAPVIINGELLGTVLGGQILDKAPNENYIRNVANEIRVDENSLWDAAQKIDIVNMKNIEAAAEVLFVVVNTLAQNGYHKIEMEQLTNNLADNFIQVSQTITDLSESAQDINFSQQKLSDEIRQVESVTKEISDVLISITKVADKTKKIGLNASIEAARMGTEGRSFSVVAAEIRNLAEASKKTADYIKNLNSQINVSLHNTIENAGQTLDITANQSAAMEELSATVQEMVNSAEKLKALTLE